MASLVFRNLITFPLLICFRLSAMSSCSSLLDITSGLPQISFSCFLDCLKFSACDLESSFVCDFSWSFLAVVSSITVYVAPLSAMNSSSVFGSRLRGLPMAA